MTNTIIISIEGNIGSGKSTLVEILKHELPCKNNDLKICFLKEPVDQWQQFKDIEGETILEKYYADQSKFAFQFQMMAYISRLSSIKKVLKENYDVIICERSVLTDKNVFAQMLYDDNKLTDIEFDIYNAWFNEFINDIPSLFTIYLKTEPITADQRVKKRSRIGENIELEYLDKCSKYHDKWLLNNENNMVIYADNDLHQSPGVLNTWVSNINQYMNTLVKSNTPSCKQVLGETYSINGI